MSGPPRSGKSYKRVPFHMIANDGNIMEHAVLVPNAQSQSLPEQGIAERYDIVIGDVYSVLTFGNNVQVRNITGIKLAYAGTVTAEAGRLGAPALIAIHDPTAGLVVRLRTSPRPTRRQRRSLRAASSERRWRLAA